MKRKHFIRALIGGCCGDDQQTRTESQRPLYLNGRLGISLDEFYMEMVHMCIAIIRQTTRLGTLRTSHVVVLGWRDDDLRLQYIIIKNGVSLDRLNAPPFVRLLRVLHEFLTNWRHSSPPALNSKLCKFTEPSWNLLYLRQLKCATLLRFCLIECTINSNWMCTYSNWNIVVGGYWISQLFRAKECSWAQDNACSAAKDSLDNHLEWLASCITPATRLCFHSTMARACQTTIFSLN